MLKAKLEKEPMKQMVYNTLLRAIIAGDLEPGKQLDEKDISERLGVSRTPLREAINRLVQEGLVLEVPYRGNFVRTYSAKEISDLYEVRKTLEVMAIRQAVARMSDQEAEEISRLVHLTADALASGDREAYSTHDSEFHGKLAQYAGNDVLIRMLSSMDSQVKLIRHMANKSDDTVKQAQFDREQILEAIAKRDVELAARFMERHIDRVMKDVVSSLPE